MQVLKIDLTSSLPQVSPRKRDILIALASALLPMQATASSRAANRPLPAVRQPTCRKLTHGYQTATTSQFCPGRLQPQGPVSAHEKQPKTLKHFTQQRRHQQVERQRLQQRGRPSLGGCQTATMPQTRPGRPCRRGPRRFCQTYRRPHLPRTLQQSQRRSHAHACWKRIQRQMTAEAFQATNLLITNPLHTEQKPRKLLWD